MKSEKCRYIDIKQILRRDERRGTSVLPKGIRLFAFSFIPQLCLR